MRGTDDPAADEDPLSDSSPRGLEMLGVAARRPSATTAASAARALLDGLICVRARAASTDAGAGTGAVMERVGGKRARSAAPAERSLGLPSLP